MPANPVVHTWHKDAEEPDFKVLETNGQHGLASVITEVEEISRWSYAISFSVSVHPYEGLPILTEQLGPFVKDSLGPSESHLCPYALAEAAVEHYLGLDAMPRATGSQMQHH